MSVSVRVQIDLRRLGLREIADVVLGPQSRTELSAAMGEAVREKTRQHLIVEAGKRHSTADRLGAAHTGHLEQAWQAVEGAPIEATADDATLTINVPGLGRAFHDVTIAGPKGQTIPVAAIAYGRRAGEFNLYKFTSKTTGNTFLALRQEDRNAPPIIYYLLVRSVTQKQDRTLLPSDQEWEQAAAGGAVQWYHRRLAPFTGGKS
jgi:hypothetical protein